jgi:hypothetical protein
MAKPTSGPFEDYPPGVANKFTVTLELRMVHDANGNGTPNWGDTIQFAVTNTTETPVNQITVTGKQDGAVVYTAAILNMGMPITLKSNQWTSGAADLRAEAITFESATKSDVVGFLDVHVEA